MVQNKKLLIAASTLGELSGAKKIKETNNADILITGVGAFFSIYNLTKLLNQKHYDLALFFGICGLYDFNEDLLGVYSVETTRFLNLGIEDDDGNFVPLSKTNFVENGYLNYNNGCFFNPSAKLLNKKIVTCNTVTQCKTEKKYVTQMLKKFPAQIETMESAAFSMVCLNENQKFLEIRCASNYVKPKKEQKWRIKSAIEKLGEEIDYLLSSNILDSIC